MELRSPSPALSRASSGVHKKSEMSTILDSCLKQFKSQLPKTINKTTKVKFFQFVPRYNTAIGACKEGNLIYANLARNEITIKRMFKSKIRSLAVHPECQSAFVIVNQTLVLVGFPGFSIIQEWKKCPVNKLEYSPSGVLMATDGKTNILKWKWNGFSLIPMSFNISCTAVKDIFLSPSAEYVIFRTTDSLVLCSSQGSVRKIKSQTSDCSVFISDSLSKVAVLEDRKEDTEGVNINIMALHNLKTAFKLKSGDSRSDITKLIFANNDAHIICALKGGNVKIWELSSLKRHVELKLHKGEINDIVFDDVSQSIYSVGKDSSFLSTPFPVFPTEYQTKFSSIGQVCAIPSTNRVIVSDDEDFILHDIDCCTFLGHSARVPYKSEITVMKYSESRKALFIGTKKDESFSLLSFSTENRCFEEEPIEIENQIVDMSLNRNESLLFIAGYAQYITIYKIFTKDIIGFLRGHSEAVIATLHIDKNTTLISSGTDKTIRIWDYMNDEKEPVVLKDHNESVDFLAKTPDENILVSATETKDIYVWSLLNLKVIKKISVHKDEIMNISIDCSGKFLYSMDEASNFYMWSLKTFNKVYHEKAEDYEFFTFADDETKIIFTSDRKLKTVSNPLKNKNLSIVGLNEHQTFMNYYVELIDRKSLPPYNPKMDSGLIMPFMINPMHLYAFLNIPLYLKQSLANDSSIIFTSSKENPLSLAINRQFRTCIDKFIKYFTHRVKEDPSMLACLTKEMLFKLNSFGEPSLFKLYRIFMRKSKDLTLPQFLDKEVKTPVYALSSSIKLSIENFDIEMKNDMEDLKAVSFYDSCIKLNYERGSTSSLKFLRSMLDSPNPDIFKTLFVKKYLEYKWSQNKWAMYTQGIIYIAYLVSLVMYLLFFYLEPHRPTGLYLILPFCLNLILFAYEGFQMFKDFKNYMKSVWNYTDIIRSILAFTYIIMLWAGLKEEEQKNLLFVLVSASFVRGISYFRLIKTTRYMVNLLSEVIKNMLSFFIMLAYTTLSFALAFYLLVDSDKNAWSSVLNSYLINVGEFTTDGFEPLEWVIFVFATIVNPIIMLNLLISIMADTYASVQRNIEIADNKELAEMILEVEGLYAKNKDKKEKKYLQICDTHHIKNDRGVIERKLKQMKKKFKNLEMENKQQFELLHNEMRKNDIEQKNLIQRVLKCVETETKLTKVEEQKNRSFRFDLEEEKSASGSEEYESGSEDSDN